MMHIEHVAIYTIDLEHMKSFYEKYFYCKANKKYFNPKTSFSSYFLTFPTGAKIELMHREGLSHKMGNRLGFHHFAISLTSPEEVIKFTNSLSNDGVKVVSAPRTTGDGYFESVIEDPEGNIIELTSSKPDTF
jgi:lactoylglutathione lyase